MRRRRVFPKVTRELLSLEHDVAKCGYGRLCNWCVTTALPDGGEAAKLVVDTEYYVGFLGPENVDVALSLSLDGCDPSELP